MALGITRRLGAYVPKAYAREQNLYCFSFTSNGASTPQTLIEDENDAVADGAETGGLITSIARAGAGQYTVTLAARFKRVRAFVSVGKTDCYGNAWMTTEGGSAANVLTVETAEAGTLADIDVRIDVLLVGTAAAG